MGKKGSKKGVAAARLARRLAGSARLRGGRAARRVIKELSAVFASKVIHYGPEDLDRLTVDFGPLTSPEYGVARAAVALAPGRVVIARVKPKASRMADDVGPDRDQLVHSDPEESPDVEDEVEQGRVQCTKESPAPKLSRKDAALSQGAWALGQAPPSTLAEQLERGDFEAAKESRKPEPMPKPVRLASGKDLKKRRAALIRKRCDAIGQATIARICRPVPVPPKPEPVPSPRWVSVQSKIDQDPELAFMRSRD